MESARCPNCHEFSGFSKKRNCFYCAECELAFDPPVQILEPQTIFLSYAHKSDRIEDYDYSEELVLLVKAELEKDGHHVWIDQEGIASGSHWRERITSAILSHTHFLSFLSKRSVRDPGVCLNEIAIALGSGRNIQTLLTESEDQVRLPLTISHIQWHQFQDWKEIKEGRKLGSNGEAWTEWFASKMAELRLNLSDIQRAKVAGDMQKLKEILEPITFESDIIAKIDGFYGRSWLFEACDKWLNESDDRLFWIKGSPGVGKSAFAAKLVHQANSAIVGFFKCDFQNNKSPEDSASECIKTLSYQLASRLPDYRMKLLYQQNIDKEKVQKKTADDLFAYLITEPLNESGKIPEATRLALVIDALDEAGHNNGSNPLADLLCKHVDKLPSWLGVIVTSRPEPYLERQLERFTTTSVDGGSAQNVEDIKNYLDDFFDSSIQDPRRAEIIHHILEKSGGTFLYIKLITNDKTLDITNPANLPAGIGEIFMRDFRRYFPQTEGSYEAYIEPFLRLLVAAPGPMPVELIQEILNLSLRELVTKILEPLGSLIQDRNGGLFLFHKSLSDWLQDARQSGRYVVESNGKEQLGNYLWEEFKQGKESKWRRWVLIWLPSLFQHTPHWNQREDLQVFADFLEKYGKYISVVSMRQRVLELVGKTFGELSIESACAQFELGAIQRRVSKYEEAECTLKKSLRVQEELKLNKEDRYTKTLDELAFNIKDQVKLEESLQLFKKSLIIRQEVFPDEQSKIADSLCNIAELYDSQGKFIEADEAYQQSLIAHSYSAKAPSLSLAALLNNYAILKLRMNGGLLFGPESTFIYQSSPFTEAKLFIEKAIEIVKQIRDSSVHPDIGVFLNNLGVVLHNMGNQGDALSIYIQARDIFQESLGRDHPLVATSLNNIGGLSTSFELNLNIADTYLRAVEIYEAKMGKDHPHVARCLNNLGVDAFNEGQIDSAIRYYEQGLQIYIDKLGQTHCDTAQLQINLAVALMVRDGASYRNNELFVHALTNLRKALGEKHPLTASLYIHLGRSYRLLGEDRKSAEAYESGISLLIPRISEDRIKLLEVEYSFVNDRFLDGKVTVEFEKAEISHEKERTIDLSFLNKINQTEGNLKDQENLYLRDQLEVLDVGIFNATYLNKLNLLQTQ